MSTTMAFVRMLTGLLKDPQLGPRIVPIVADEARTFGMANLFKQVGIYSSIGQHYAPEDIGSVLSYREALDGQILEEGISEASALASWTAAATSYSVHGLAMLPFYIYYSMFGFQRVGDADLGCRRPARARLPAGRHLGPHHAGWRRAAAPGRQQPPGGRHHPQLPRLGPGLRLRTGADPGPRHARDAGRAARRLPLHHADEREPRPTRPARRRRRPGVLRGAYRFTSLGPADAAQAVTLMGSGAILSEVLKAGHQLAAEGWQVDVVSVTSWSELARDGGARGA
jgi:pyruvate dehydrogenase E1 component